MPRTLTHHRVRVALLTPGGFVYTHDRRAWWPGHTHITVVPHDQLPAVVRRTRRPDRVLGELRGATSAADLRRRAAYAGGPYPDTDQES